MIRGYRKDIDGLRAVAVSMVIAYHAGWTLLRGGFVGVDVFFVISGYLIGSMIIDEVKAGRFSLIGFYERRVRRIFPALAVMLMAASVAAYLYLLPGELESYGRSVIAATFSYSNFYFAQRAGYFMPAASSLPLLHTWSLAIEEQFYVFLPLFVLLVHRLWPARLGAILLGVALVSLGFSVRGALVNDSLEFYMPQARAWELLLGTLLSCARLPQPRPGRWREGIGLLGLVLIAAPAFAYSESTRFPGYAALAPCLGTALLIGLGLSGTSIVARGLSWGPVVFIGRISYSLYLWHWPIFIFLRLSEHVPGDRHVWATKLGAIAATVAISTLSWRYVETPFRTGPRRPSRRVLFAVAGCAAALLLAAGLTAVRTAGLPGRFSPSALALAAELTASQQAHDTARDMHCFVDFADPATNLRSYGCLKTEAARPNYLIIGDSFASHLWLGLATAFDKINFMQATGAGCTPLLDRKYTPACNALTAFLFSDYLLHHKPDRLVVSARWLNSDLRQLGELLDWTKAHDLPVILMGPTPRYDDRLPRLLVFSQQRDDPGLVDNHRIDLNRLDKAMRALAESKGAAYVSMLDALCEGGHCQTLAAPGIPLQYDDGHLTKQGSVVAGQRLRALGSFPVMPPATN
jgi:peptidoglycan/LPS O-acetylase OafA/YrhL